MKDITIYMNERMQPVDKEGAVFAKVVRANGEKLFLDLRPKTEATSIDIGEPTPEQIALFEAMNLS
jgi:hypothetical protein